MYLYNNYGQELAKFRDISYAYSPMISPDGKEFYNIERHSNDLKTALSIYNTSDFSLKKRILSDNYNTVLTAIEYSIEEKMIFLLGYMRHSTSGVAHKFFVGKLSNDNLQNIVYISPREHDFYLACKRSEIHENGIFERYTSDEADKTADAKHSLAELWKFYSI